MNIGVIGMGKLGLPMALAIDESKRHQVLGYDPNKGEIDEYLNGKKEYPYPEEFIKERLARNLIYMAPLDQVCEFGDILFLIPPTPHGPEYEGITPLPATRSDFDYSTLIRCVRDVDAALNVPKVCVIVSTVLPGTIEREILPIISDRFMLAYSPQFAAMGTVIPNFLNPEFYLIGYDNARAYTKLRDFYKLINPRTYVIDCDIKTAEGIKVIYNCFITMKTCFANAYGELSHRIGMDANVIHQALLSSTSRLISEKYLEPGMGDGGCCHPRDNIAMSWLARQIGMSSDFFGGLMETRQQHAKWLADMVAAESKARNLPIFILGRAFKPESTLDTGSAPLLVAHYLNLDQKYVSNDLPADLPASVILIGTKHKRYREQPFPAGSLVIDPFRYIPDQQGVTIIRIGE